MNGTRAIIGDSFHLVAVAESLVSLDVNLAKAILISPKQRYLFFHMN